jgi:NTE family protein
LDEKLLVDGGIIENIPIDTVKNMGADYVIGVDLNAIKTYIGLIR